MLSSGILVADYLYQMLTSLLPGTFYTLESSLYKDREEVRLSTWKGRGVLAVSVSALRME